MQLRYESNRELKRIIKERFQESYEYLLAEKQRSRVNWETESFPRLPADRREYIDFYETDKPYRFRIELITNQDDSAKTSLAPENILKYDSVIRHFGCSNEGKIRTTNSNSLVLIADHTNSSWYEDYWDEDRVFHFLSDQIEVITDTVNDTMSMFLFEIYETGRYLFKGRVNLAASPYQEEQPDEYGVLQNVRVYPMKLADEQQEVESSGASAIQLQ